MKKKRFLAIPLCALFILSAGLLGACGGNNDNAGDANPPDNQGTTTPPDDQGTQNKPSEEPTGSLVPTKAYEIPDKYMAEDRTTTVSVHDPSIFKDPKTGKFYAFGSHYAVASSSDLVTWKQEMSDDTTNGANVALFGGSVATAIPQTYALARQNGDAWAPDVEYYNGKYYMYISYTTKMYTSTSVIIRVESDNVLGPYSNEKILLESISPNESTNTKPNCIDPELFYDKDGGLWMVYGSFFGGIYIKELYNSGENWGLPKDEGLNNWGKRIWKDGQSAGVEGPYVFYNELTDYYYLMTSEADLMKDYNMRIARSKNPDGPYEDVTGADVAAAGKGNKVAGNYKFARQSGNGYAAMGHNSVIKHNGKYFVVYHARRVGVDNKGQASVFAPHSLHVSQLFFNEDGWPVMSPNFYVGEEFGTIPETDVAVDYEILVHAVKNEAAPTGSENYALVSDGTVKKGTAVLENSSWTLKQNYYIELTISGVTYKGVVVPGWDAYSAKKNQKAVLGITAISDTGLSLWGLSK